ncbi:hypothetical protein L5515_004342 [Caenorhabditis briggsae]|uniref:Uncharacterized protein n=1 Tax=Caenorhabditis briggsae TaxID=6238 RepID=A0AAE9ELL5_CAEBR|nr:hypothetical protein L5515_004342 [Caenorhabditis briggsae]
MEQFVKGLPYPYEEACKEIVRRRNSYESADKLVRHAIHVNDRNAPFIWHGSCTNRSSELKIPITGRQR